MSNIDHLCRKYKELVADSIISPQERGYAFEKLLWTLFDLTEMSAREPFRSAGDQIDGSCVWRNREYFVEAKWTADPLDQKEVDAFFQKLRRANKPGLMFSVGGFSKNVKLNDDTPELLLFRKGDIDAIMHKKLSITEFIDIKLSYWPQKKRLHYHPNSRVFRDTEWHNSLQHFHKITQTEIASIGSKYISHLYVQRSAALPITKLLHDKNPQSSLALVIERAGAGKTNLLCHLAEHYALNSPVFIVRAGIHLNGTFGLTQYIADLYAPVEKQTSRSGEEFIFKHARLAEAHGKHLLIFVDALNESLTPQLLKEELLAGLARWRTENIITIVTCRDIYWDAFDDPRWHQFKPCRLRNKMFLFHQDEYDGPHGALSRYFDYFKVSGKLAGHAYERCKHPLLLNFFCRTYEGESFDQISELRLLDLFDEYWRRKVVDPDSTRHRISSPDDGPAAQYLLRLAASMLERGEAIVPKDKLHSITGDSDNTDYNSTYVKLLDEHILIEETTKASLTGVQFVYEEFMEYVIALHFVQKLLNKNTDEIRAAVLAFLDSAPNFLRGVGVLVFIALMLKTRRDISVWPVLASERRFQATTALFDALRLMSEDGLDESIDELLCELMRPNATRDNRIRAIELCRFPPYVNRPSLHGVLCDCTNTKDKKVRDAAIISLIMWQDNFSVPQLNTILQNNSGKTVPTICRSIASGNFGITRDGIAGLIKIMLQYNRDTIRTHVSVALAGLADEAAIAQLGEILNASGVKVRKLIAGQCKSLHHDDSTLEAASNLLEMLCCDSDNGIVTQSVEAYADYATDRSINFLLNQACRSDWCTDVKDCILEQLVKYTRRLALGYNSSPPETSDVQEAIHLLTSSDQDNHSEIVDRIRSSPDKWRFLVHWVSIYAGDVGRHVFTTLLKKKEKREVLTVLLHESHRLSDEMDVVIAISKLAQTGSYAVRRLATKTLGHMPSLKATQFLVDLLKDNNPEIVSDAMSGLASKPLNVVEPALLEMVQRDLGSAVRQKLASTIARLDPRAARSALQWLASRDRSPRVQKFAEESLQFIDARVH